MWPQTPTALSKSRNKNSAYRQQKYIDTKAERWLPKAARKGVKLRGWRASTVDGMLALNADNLGSIPTSHTLPWALPAGISENRALRSNGKL